MKIGTLVFRCPLTAHDIDSGIDVDLPTWRWIGRLDVRLCCRGCGRTHDFKVAEGTLACYRIAGESGAAPAAAAAAEGSASPPKKPSGRRPMVPTSVKERLNVPGERRATGDPIKRILKLRWMGLEDEAEDMRVALRQIEPGVALLAGPYDTD